MADQIRDYSDEAILRLRGAKETVDPFLPYAFFVEPECGPQKQVEDVATIFLTNRECPYRCLMCDLWKHTTDESVPVGAIPAQIDFALSRLPSASSIKLYNSGNFFDRKAIPVEDHPHIASRLGSFSRVIVENHPNLVSDKCVQFRDLIAGDLEIAMGLETVHPQVLKSLNKRMTVADFGRATSFLRSHEISVRAFILLRPPWLSEAEGIEWALKSIEFAFAAGVECCSVIPTRSGNGMMEHLQDDEDFQPPGLESLEKVMESALALGRGRVFVDLWDVEKLFDCQHCGPGRRERLRQMNLTQQFIAPIACPVGCRD